MKKTTNKENKLKKTDWNKELEKIRSVRIKVKIKNFDCVKFIHENR